MEMKKVGGGPARHQPPPKVIVHYQRESFMGHPCTPCPLRWYCKGTMKERTYKARPQRTSMKRKM